MTSSYIFEFVIRHPGLVFVLVGVAGEVICEWKKEKKRRERLKQMFAVLLVVGLAWEFIEAAESDKEIATLNGKASAAEERTANIESTNTALLFQVEQLHSTNLVFRAKVVALEMKQQHRSVTPEQLANFGLLTEKITKIPITVSIGQEGYDTEHFAFHLREMFTKAGFTTNSGAGPFGIFRDPTRVYVSRIGIATTSADIIIVVPSEEEFDKMNAQRFPIEVIKGFKRPIVISTNRTEIYSAINFILPQIGIKGAFWASQWKPPREFEVLVPLKDQF